MARKIGIVCLGICHTFVKSNADDSDVQNLVPRKPQQGCEKYNSIYHRLSFADRREKCIADSASAACHFSGWSMSGKCESLPLRDSETTAPKNSIDNADKTPLSPLPASSASSPLPSDSASFPTSNSVATTSTTVIDKKVLESAPISSSHADRQTQPELSPTSTTSTSTDSDSDTEMIDTDVENQARKMLQAHVAISAVDSLRSTEAHDMAQEEAFALVMQLLTDPVYPAKVGEFLQYLFAFESVLAPTRDLIHWSLHQHETTEAMQLLCNGQRNYWLRAREGKRYTHMHLVSLVSWWLSDEEVRKETVVPLLTYYVTDRDMVVDVVKASVVDALKEKQTKVMM